MSRMFTFFMLIMLLVLLWGACFAPTSAGAGENQQSVIKLDGPQLSSGRGERGVLRWSRGFLTSSRGVTTAPTIPIGISCSLPTRGPPFSNSESLRVG